MPTVSIVIPAYNASRYIEECLDSVLNQTYGDFEVYVCDDGSDDDTRALVSRYEARDPRLSLIELNHGGAGAARNAGMKLATGDFYYFLDADDFLENNALETMVAAAKSHEADVVVFGSHYLDDVSKEERPIDFTMKEVPRGALLEGDTLPAKPFQSFVGWPWDKLFRAEFVKRHALTFQELRSSNDARFVFLALCLAKRMVCLDEDLIVHRTNNADSLEHTRSKSWGNSVEAMKGIRDELLARDLSRDAWVSYANWVSHFSYWSMSSLDNGALSPEVVEVFVDFASAVQIDPDEYYVDEDQAFAVLMAASRFEAIKSYIELRADSESKIKNLLIDLGRTKGELEAKSRALEASRKEVEDVRLSWSYRIGNALIKPLSLLKKAVK